MPLQLLPANAKAFAPRSAPNIVLDYSRRVDDWLTQTLKRIRPATRVKRPLNSVPQHYRCLVDTLAGPAAIWTLASLMLPIAPEMDLPLPGRVSDFHIVDTEAYVVHVDMVAQHEVAFKLTPETIDTLIVHHKSVYCKDMAASTFDWPEKDAQIKKIHEEFVQAVNRFVFRTGARVLEGLEEDGAGELLEGRSADAKAAIMNLFLPLSPPPPRIEDVVYPAPLVSNSTLPQGTWWPDMHQTGVLPTHVSSWEVVPSNIGPTPTPCHDGYPPNFWASMGLDTVQLPSPTPSVSQPTFSSSAEYFSPMQVMNNFSTALPTASLPCGPSMMSTGFDSYGWQHNAFAPRYAAI